MATYQINEELEVPASLEQVWDFISSPSNLEEITPDYMRFEITTPGLPDKILKFNGTKFSWLRPPKGMDNNLSCSSHGIGDGIDTLQQAS